MRQIIKRAALALTFILALISVPVVADDVFTDKPIPEGVNQSFLITECGVPIIVGIAVFEGPETTKGSLIVIPDGLLPIPMNVIISEIILDYKANGPVIELTDLMDRHCA